MGIQHLFDLGRRHPEAGDLEHLVVPADVPEDPVLALVDHVPGVEPFAAEGLLGLLVPVPVAARDAVALDHQDALFARRDVLPQLVDDPGLVAPNRLSQAARAAQPRRGSHVPLQRLGRTQDGEDFAPGQCEPFVIKGLAQRLASGVIALHAAAFLGVLSRLGQIVVKGLVDRRHGEHLRRPELAQIRHHHFGGGALPFQHDRGAGEEGNPQRIPQTVGKEQLAGGVQDIDRRDVVVVLVQVVRRIVDVVLQMNRSLWLPCGAGRVTPECGVVLVCLGGLQRVRLARDSGPIAHDVESLAIPDGAGPATAVFEDHDVPQILQ